MPGHAAFVKEVVHHVQPHADATRQPVLVKVVAADKGVVHRRLIVDAARVPEGVADNAATSGQAVGVPSRPANAVGDDVVVKDHAQVRSLEAGWATAGSGSVPSLRMSSSGVAPHSTIRLSS